MRYQCRGLADLVDTDDQLKCGVIFEQPVNEHLSTIIVKAQIECAVEDEQQGRFLSGASQAHYDFSGCKLQFAGTERFDGLIIRAFVSVYLKPSRTVSKTVAQRRGYEQLRSKPVQARKSTRLNSSH